MYKLSTCTTQESFYVTLTNVTGKLMDLKEEDGGKEVVWTDGEWYLIEEARHREARMKMESRGEQPCDEILADELARDYLGANQ